MKIWWVYARSVCSSLTRWETALLHQNLQETLLPGPNLAAPLLGFGNLIVNGQFTFKGNQPPPPPIKPAVFPTKDQVRKPIIIMERMFKPVEFGECSNNMELALVSYEENGKQVEESGEQAATVLTLISTEGGGLKRSGGILQPSPTKVSIPALLKTMH